MPVSDGESHVPGRSHMVLIMIHNWAATNLRKEIEDQIETMKGFFMRTNQQLDGGPPFSVAKNADSRREHVKLGQVIT